MRKNDKKVDDLAKAFGDHLPIEDKRFGELKDNFLELKKILLAQNDKSDEFHKKVDGHMERVEPVIKAYETSKTFNEELAKKGSAIIKTGGVASALGAIYFILIHGFPK